MSRLMLNSSYLNGWALGSLSSIGLHEEDVRNSDQSYKQDYMKALLNSFSLNGHTLGFHPQT